MKKPIVLLALLFLSACATKPSQDVYRQSEVGESRAVEFGTVLHVREVVIAADNEGEGKTLGALAGGGGGSYGGGHSGQIWTIAGGAVAGAILGNAIQEEVFSENGHEYTVRLQSGAVKTIVQREARDEPVFKPGDKVMLQYCDAGDYNRKCAPNANNRPFQRLLLVDALPPYETKSKSKKKTRRVEIEQYDNEQEYITQ